MSWLREPTYHTWSGASHTWATVRVWDEAAWRYRDTVEHVLGRDAWDDYRRLHSLLHIVERVSYV